MVRNLSKKGISPVIATILLLAITVIIAVGVYQFLNTYTQDTFDNISGDATIDLQFANRITMYNSGTDVIMNIGRTQYPEDLNITEIVFQGPNSLTINCVNATGFEVLAGQSNPITLNSTTGGASCTQSNFVNGQYNIIMIGDTTVRVEGVTYR